MHWSIEQCRFADSGAAAVRLDLHCRNNRIDGNVIERVGGVGVLLAGYGPGTKDVNTGNSVSGNHIHHIGELYWHSPAIFAWQSGSNRIANNLIHHTPVVCGPGKRRLPPEAGFPGPDARLRTDRPERDRADRTPAERGRHEVKVTLIRPTYKTLLTVLANPSGDLLRPAWPKDWDVEFHAPKNTIIEGKVVAGQVVDLKVTPESRRRDVTTDRSHMKIRKSLVAALSGAGVLAQVAAFIALAMPLAKAADLPSTAQNHDPAIHGTSSADNGRQPENLQPTEDGQRAVYTIAQSANQTVEWKINFK
jgi:hypothetical protein